MNAYACDMCVLVLMVMVLLCSIPIDPRRLTKEYPLMTKTPVQTRPVLPQDVRTCNDQPLPGTSVPALPLTMDTAKLPITCINNVKAIHHNKERST